MFYRWVLLLLVMTVAIHGADPTQNIKNVVGSLKRVFCNIVPVVFMLAIAASAILYAGGQMLGAEQRARMASWATNLFLFAIVGALVYVIVPWILGELMPSFKDKLSCPSTGDTDNPT